MSDEEQEITVELVHDADTADHKMVNALGTFIASFAPVMLDDGTLDPHGQAMTPLLRESRDIALIAAFRRIERIAGRGEREFGIPFPESDGPCHTPYRPKRKRPSASLTRPTARSAGPPATPE